MSHPFGLRLLTFQIRWILPSVCPPIGPFSFSSFAVFRLVSNFICVLVFPIENQYLSYQISLWSLHYLFLPSKSFIVLLVIRSGIIPNLAAKAHSNLDTQYLFSLISCSSRHESAAPFWPILSLFFLYIPEPFLCTFPPPSWLSQRASQILSLLWVISCILFYRAFPECSKPHPSLFPKLLSHLKCAS